MANQNISVFLQLRDQLSAGMTRVGSTFDKVNGKASSMLDQFSSMSVAGLAGFGAVVAGATKAFDAIQQLTKEGIELNRAFESTQIRIAGTLKAFDVAPTFAKAQVQASNVMTTIADLAARLPGETEDYVSVFATALPKVLAAGLTDMRQVAEFTSKFTAVATSNMVDSTQAGMDLFRMLSGQAGADVRMFTVLAEKFGITAEAFNKLAAAERLAAIQKAIGAFDDQLIAAGDTYDAKAGEMESRLKEIKRLGTELAFSKAKSDLSEMNEVLKLNKDELVLIDQVMSSSYEKGVSFVDKVTMGLKLVAGHTLKGFYDLPENMQNAIRMMGPAFAFLPDVKKSKKPTAAADAVASDLDKAAEQLQARKDEFEAEKFQTVIDLLPKKLQSALIGGPSGFLSPAATEKFVEIAKEKLKTKKTEDYEMANRIDKYLSFMLPREGDFLSTRIFGLPESKIKKKPVERRAAPKAPVTNFYNSRFDIKQEFAEGFDPDRIAVAFSQDLARLGEMKVMSGYAPLFTGR